MQMDENEDKDTGEPFMPVSCSDLLIEEDILNLFLLQIEDCDREWEICFIKENKDVIAALVVPKDMQYAVTDSCVQLEASMIKEQYLVFYDFLNNKLICPPIKERGISQLCFFEEEGRVYIGIIYKISFSGWEEYSMKWLCYEKGTLKRFWKKEEREDPYHYWKNRKPVFDRDNTISVFLRKGQEGAFEALMQNSELTAMESYSDYVPEYQWEIECKYCMAQWMEEGIFADDEAVMTEETLSEERERLTGIELVSLLFDIEKTNDLPNPIYFSTGFEGAAVEIYDNLKKGDLAETAETYFVVKKYSTSHESGFQSLYIGSIDSEQRKIIQCFEYLGDHAAAKFVSNEKGQFILFYAETVSNGIPTTVGGIWKAEAGNLSLIWPYSLEDPDAFACEGYWHPCSCSKNEENHAVGTGELPVHRTARLENEKLKIYRINFTFYPDSSMIAGYDLVFEKEIGIE